MTKERVFKQIESSIETMQNIMVECIKIIYNAGYNNAIEEATKRVDSWTRMDQAGYDFEPAMEIRKLKK